ncbi:SDR family NAD(P)-dependent oxidoreductase [Pseudomonas sp. CCC3.2]|uniref:SDR family NAD(P)-dependent oxidoreductase n=1 Tax=unclassified Pseudomonas TaxID=196821 RepID=UPI0034DCFDDB
MSFAFDVTVACDRQKAYDFILDQAGRVAVLINNAGIHFEGEPRIEHINSASTVPENVLRKTMEVNFFAPVALTQKLLPQLHQSKAGRIVNMSSILGSLTLGARSNGI